jgi:hypothetical protein
MGGWRLADEQLPGPAGQAARDARDWSWTIPVPGPGRPDCHGCCEPVDGTPAYDPDDPLRRPFHPRCLTPAAEAGFEQRYQPGVTS